jgi:hypothetical protein
MAFSSSVGTSRHNDVQLPMGILYDYYGSQCWMIWQESIGGLLSNFII